MKKILSIIIFAIVLFIFVSCGGSLGNTLKDWGFSSRNSEAKRSDTTIYSPYDSSDFSGMDYAQVDILLREAGFEHITLTPIDDIDSNSDIADGTVESVKINEMEEFTTNSEFTKDSTIIVTYHNIPKVSIPITPEDALTMHYMDVGQMFFDAGFINIHTDEVYDLSVNTPSKTVITIKGKEINDETQLPFDGEISIIEHYPISEYTTIISIVFEENWIFSKYNVVVTLDGSTLGTLSHGENGTYKVMLPAGKHDLVFSNEKKPSVSGNVTLTVNSDMTETYHISCNRKTVDIDLIDDTRAVKDSNLLMPFSSHHFLRKDYHEAMNELKELGFTHITTEATTKTLWVPDKVDTVVGIEIDGKTEINHDDLFDKSAAVIVYFHVADFQFTQDEIKVTEKDTFNLGYSLNSGDLIDSINFRIDNKDVLKRNEDGSYTALIPGIATVTAYSEDHDYSTCRVEITEIIVPVEKVILEYSEKEISVGSTFKIDYKLFPENANYTEIRVETSNEYIEIGDDFTFYSNQAGDSEVSFYQDDRLLGSCSIHAVFVEVERLSLVEAVEEIDIGDTVDLVFTVFPANATNKGVKVVSSNPQVADVSFNERGASAITVVGKSAGKAKITITTPSGVSYTHLITVKEVLPTEITLSFTDPNQRIEVGTPINIDVRWIPEKTSIKELVWTSNNNKVIKVDKGGRLEAVGVGTAKLTAKHKSGVSTTITITVEPTLVTKVEIITDRGGSKELYSGDKFTINTAIFPENATNKILTFSSSDELVAKVSNKGVVTAVGAGTAIITVASSDGAKTTIPITVLPSPQKFKITWSASRISNDHVGENWSTYFEVNNERFGKGQTIILNPGSSFTVCFIVEENDTYPDTGMYRKEIKYSDDLCRNGYTISTTVTVVENRGRYSGHCAEWSLKIIITPVK